MLATLAGISLAADIGVVINPALDRDLGVPKLQSAIYSSMGQKGSNTSVEFRSAKVSEVLNWLRANGYSFVVNDTDIPSNKSISLNIVNQPVGAVAEAIANALGGHWESTNGIHVYKKGSLGTNWMKVPSEGSMIWGGELPGNALQKEAGSGDPFGPEFQLKIQKEAGPEFQKNFVEQFGPDFAKKMKDQFGPEFQKKMKEEFGDNFESKIQKEFGPGFQKQIEEQFGPKFQKHIQEMTAEIQKQHARKGSNDSNNKMELELESKIQKQMEGQFGPKFQMKLEEQFGPKFQKQMEELGAQMEKEQRLNKGLAPQSNERFRVFALPHSLGGNRNHSMLPSNGNSFNPAHFINTLTPDQRDQQKKQGYVWYTDLTSEQKRMFESFNGKFDISLKIDGEEVRVKRN